MKALLALMLLLGACAPADVERPEPGEVGRPPSRHSRFHRFRVNATAVPAEIKHDLALREIAKLPGVSAAGLRTQGLTTIKHSMARHARFSTAKGNASVYAWFDDVILDVAVSSIVIHIPKEYAPGSCEYEIVLEHERAHGRAAREQAVIFAGQLERALMASDSIPTRFDPVISRDFATAAAELDAAIGKVVDPVYDQYEKEEKAVQETLDRPDPYDVVYKKCDGWR